MPLKPFNDKRFEQDDYFRRPDPPSFRRFFGKLLLAVFTLLLFVFVFISPYWERQHHINELQQKPVEEWGHHLDALCGIRVGRELLYQHIVSATDQHREDLLRTLSGNDCLEDMGADVQTEAYFLLEDAGDPLAPTPMQTAAVLERASLALARSEPGSRQALHTMTLLERGWTRLTTAQRARLALPLSFQLPHPQAQELLVRTPSDTIPPLLAALHGPRDEHLAAKRGLDVLEPQMNEAQRLEYELVERDLDPVPAQPDNTPAPFPLVDKLQPIRPKPQPPGHNVEPDLSDDPDASTPEPTLAPSQDAEDEAEAQPDEAPPILDDARADTPPPPADTPASPTQKNATPSPKERDETPPNQPLSDREEAERPPPSPPASPPAELDAGARQDVPARKDEEAGSNP